MYYLLNKDRVVAEFEQVEHEIAVTYNLVSVDNEGLPIGFKNIEDWISNRKGSKYNKYLGKFMRICGCEKKEDYLRITHAATLNDTFWIKEETESLCWNDVSLYRNEFNKDISKKIFNGEICYGLKVNGFLPELSTEGSFRKCWQKESGEVFLYKQGSEDGIEPYCEILASEISEKICHNTVSYTPVVLHDKLASKCKLFTDEKVGYVPIACFDINHSSPDDMLKFYEKIGSEDDFRRTIVLDALTFNVDRHIRNHGVLVDNDSLKPLHMAPVFDMNLSFLPYVRNKEFKQIGNELLRYEPIIGNDFTRIGQAAVSAEIRRDLSNLRGFEFSFRGDDGLPEERIKRLEHLLNKQIEALLSKEKLYTKDVFVPQMDYLKNQQKI